MSREELLLAQWRDLPIQEQIAVINFAEFLGHKNRVAIQEDIDYGGPEHLNVRSINHLNELLQEGLNSLDRGEGIEVTDESKSSEFFTVLKTLNAC